MSETPALPPPEEPAPALRRQPNLRILAVLYALGFVVLGSAMLWLWQNPPRPSRPTVDPAEVAALRQQVQGLEQRLAQAEQRAVQVDQRVGKLEQRPGPTDIGPLEARIGELEKRSPPDLAPLDARIAALEQRPLPPADLVTRGDIAGFARRDDLASLASRTDLAAFSGRLDSIAGREDQLANRQQGLETNLGNRLDGTDGKVTALEQAATGLPGKVETIDRRVATVEQEAGKACALADKAGRIGRIQAARVALDSGQPLGDLPGAPPALARFAQSRPPTEAALRLAFPAAARAAEAASRPHTDDQPFFNRVWSQAQDLVTLRQGDRVILGDPAAGVIGRARQALAAGDLGGAVAALDGLTGAPAASIAGWKAQAQALLDARAALATMAARA